MICCIFGRLATVIRLDILLRQNITFEKIVLYICEHCKVKLFLSLIKHHVSVLIPVVRRFMFSKMWSENLKTVVIMELILSYISMLKLKSTGFLALQHQ
jgi:hypothetical protein